MTPMTMWYAWGMDDETTVETIQRLLDEADALKDVEMPALLSNHEERVQRYRVHTDGIVAQFSEDVKSWLETLTN